jgi:hypothetical protein
LVLSFAAIANAQLDRATLTGTVTDPSGAAVYAARTIVTNTGTGVVWHTQTNEAGNYALPNLPPGQYAVSFEAAGFKKFVRNDVELRVAGVIRIDATLEIGAATESIEVSGAISRVQTDNAEVGMTLQSTSFLDLPLSFSGGRLPTTFAYELSPGLIGMDGKLGDVHINGSLYNSTNVLLEGADTTTSRQGHYTESSVSVDAVDEFRAQTSGISAEYGRAEGGVFNFVMKSGTNKAHGSAFIQLRNEALDANTFINNATGVRRSLDPQKDFGLSFGGPWYIPKILNRRNKTFFYAVWEKYHQTSSGLGAPSKTVPIPDFYVGNFSRLLGAVIATDALGRPVAQGAIYDPATFRLAPNGQYVGDMFPGNQIPVSRFSKVSQNLNKLLQADYPPEVFQPNGLPALVNNESVPVSGNTAFGQDNFSIKGDQVINDRNKISGSYGFNLRPRLEGYGGSTTPTMWDASDPAGYGGPLSKMYLQRLVSNMARLAWDFTISPRVLLHSMLYFNRFTNDFHTPYTDINGAQVMGIANLKTIGYPTVDYSGGPFVNLTTPGNPTLTYAVARTTGFQETVSFSHGRHFMKAGVDTRFENSDAPATPGGGFVFSPTSTAIPGAAFAGNQTGFAFASYLLGTVYSASLTDPEGVGLRYPAWAAYFQDDFKVSPRLTLNLGVRWDYFAPVYEVANRLSSWSTNTIDPKSGLPGGYEFAGNCSVCTGRDYFGVRDFKNFAPRIGFAWQAAGKWVVRGAYGIMYEGDPLPGGSSGKAYEVAWGGTYNLSANGVSPWAGIFNWDNGFPLNSYVPPAYNVSWGDTTKPAMFDPKYGIAPYIQMWNLNLQRQLPWNVLLDVGYVGNKSTKLFAGNLTQVNQLPASDLATYGARLNNAVTTAAQAAQNGIAYPYPGFAGTVASALRPYPQVQGNSTITDWEAPLGFSTYHSLQIVLNRQFARAFTVYGDYVWSKVISNVVSDDQTDSAAGVQGPLDYYNLKLEKAVNPIDTPHSIKVLLDYQLPVGRGRALLGGMNRVLNGVIGGWTLSAILQYHSSQPLLFTGSSPLSSGWNGAANRVNVAPGPLIKPGYSRGAFDYLYQADPANTYINKAAFSVPPPLNLGTAAPYYTQALGFWTRNEDAGLEKKFKLREGMRLQIRAEFLNLFNRQTLGGIITSVTSPLFGQVTSISGNRQVQLGMRLDF